MARSWFRLLIVAAALSGAGTAAVAAVPAESDRLIRRLLDHGTASAEKEAAAAELAKALGNPTVGRKLKKAIRDGSSAPDVLVPLYVLEALGMLGVAEAVPALMDRLRELPVVEQFTAATLTALAEIGERIGKPEAIEGEAVELLLARYRGDPSNLEQTKNILFALKEAKLPRPGEKATRRRFNGEPVREFLYGLLDRPDAETRKSAARAFADRGDPGRVLAALRGEGIGARRQVSVWKELIGYAVFVDPELQANREVMDEVRARVKEHPRMDIGQGAKDMLWLAEQGRFDGAAARIGRTLKKSP